MACAAVGVGTTRSVVGNVCDVQMSTGTRERERVQDTLCRTNQQRIIAKLSNLK